MDKNYVLMSIKTKYANKIFNGTKIWEYRKNLPKELVSGETTIVVYSSKVDRAIVGEFTVGTILKCSLDELMEQTGCENDPEAREWFEGYYKGKDVCCAIEVTSPIRYTSEIKLDNIKLAVPGFLPPQNFIYIRKDSLLATVVKSAERGCNEKE